MDTSIGMACIMRDEEANIARFLDEVLGAVDKVTLTPTFDQVVLLDTGSKDQTVAIARARAALDPRLEVHETTWKDSFREAREESFAFLHTSWETWADIDDSFSGLDQLRDMLISIDRDNPQITSVWLQYFYDKQPDSQAWSAVHLRERAVRANAGWHWSPFRVHEHLTTKTPGPTAKTSDIEVRHLRDRSKDPERNDRNIRLLWMDLRTYPKEPRLWFDLGSQFYHTLKWRRAIWCYRHFLALHKGPNERYQALHRMADAYRMTGRIAQAMECEKQAIFGVNGIPGRPQWADAWFGLAECATAVGDWAMVLNYNAMGNARMFGEDAIPLGMPDELLVTNPLDYTFHPLIFEHVALANLGKFDRARAYTQQALQLIPDHPDMTKADQQYLRVIQTRDATDAALAIGPLLDDEHREILYRALPMQIRSQKNIRDTLVAPTLVHKNAVDVTLWCGPSLEDWGPNSPITTGIGGSETAVVAMSEHLTRLGLSVAVYNQCGAAEGQYKPNLRYIDYTRFDQTIPTKLFVGWRNPSSQNFIPDGAKSWLWLHDLNSGPDLGAEHVARFDLLRPVSQWHADHLEWLYPFMKGRLVPTRNGIDPERFANLPKERYPHRAVWLSSPDRGLQHILQWWPEIRQRVPDAELHVFYGFETLLATAKMTNNMGLVTFRNEIIKLASQPGVHLRGRVNQTELAQELGQAASLAYSGTFLEVSAISCIECLASGCVVQATLAGAIPETCQDAAILVRGHPLSEVYRQVFISNLVALFNKPELGVGYQERGRKRAAELTWAGVAQEWSDRLDGKVTESPNGAASGGLTVGSARVA